MLFARLQAADDELPFQTLHPSLSCREKCQRETQERLRSSQTETKDHLSAVQRENAAISRQRYAIITSTIMNYISSTPEILSGMPVITGTRVPVARILSLLKEGYLLEEIQQQFDHISLETLQGALEEAATIINSSHGTHVL